MNIAGKAAHMHDGSGDDCNCEHSERARHAHHDMHAD